MCLSLQGPVGALLPEEQVLLGQLQRELGHLQAGLVQLGVGVALAGTQLPQFPAQTFGQVLADLQPLLQAPCLLQGGLCLCLRTDRRLLEDSSSHKQLVWLQLRSPVESSSFPHRASFDRRSSSVSPSAWEKKDLVS